MAATTVSGAGPEQPTITVTAAASSAPVVLETRSFIALRTPPRKRKSRTPSGPGCRFPSPVVASSPDPRGLATARGQVFWLPDRPTCRAFPSPAGDSGSPGARPRSQRRVRDGLSPSSLGPEPRRVYRSRRTVSRLSVREDSAYEWARGLGGREGSRGSRRPSAHVPKLPSPQAPESAVDPATSRTRPATGKVGDPASGFASGYAVTRPGSSIQDRVEGRHSGRSADLASAIRHLVSG